jgi:hypothetical protein
VKAQPEPAPVVDADALADLCAGVAGALNRFAAALRGGGGSTASADAPRVGDRPAGPRQQLILSLPGLAGSTGMTSAAVAKALNLRVQNAHNALVRLSAVGELERVPDEHPAHWRLKK